MEKISGLMFFIGFLVCIVCYLVIVINAFQHSFSSGVLSFLVGSFSVAFVSDLRKDRIMWRTFLVWLVSFVGMILGASIIPT